MLKDIIGKDLSKMTLPVYFNDPLNLLQRLSAGFEYYDILERAAVDPDPVRRAAYLAILQISMCSCTVRSNKKPFNALLGETYEMVTNDYKYLAE